MYNQRNQQEIREALEFEASMKVIQSALGLFNRRLRRLTAQFTWQDHRWTQFQSFLDQSRQINRTKKDYTNAALDLRSEGRSVSEIVRELGPVIEDSHNQIINLTNKLNEIIESEDLIYDEINDQFISQLVSSPETSIEIESSGSVRESTAESVRESTSGSVRESSAESVRDSTSGSIRESTAESTGIEQISEKIIFQVEVPLVRYNNFYSPLSLNENFINNWYRGIRPELRVQYRLTSAGTSQIYVGVHCDFNLNFSNFQSKNYGKSKLVGIRYYDTIIELSRIQNKTQSDLSISLGQSCSIKTKQFSVHGNLILKNKTLKKENLSFEFRFKTTPKMVFSKNNLFVTVEPILSCEMFPFPNNLQKMSCNPVENKLKNSTLPLASINDNQNNRSISINSTINEVEARSHGASAEAADEFALPVNETNLVSERQMMVGVETKSMEAPRFQITHQVALLALIFSTGVLIGRWLRNKVNKNL